MQYFALPMGVAAAFAIVSIGRDGSSQYPLIAAATWRKNFRLPITGRRQNTEPRALLQSQPKRSLPGVVIE
jgi:hypothetical protein